MILEIRGMATASQKFVQLWGVEVSGFRPEKHCIYCLKGRKEPQLHRDMVDGDYVLKTDAPYFISSPWEECRSTRRTCTSR